MEVSLAKRVNTLDRFNQRLELSVYSPSQRAVILTAGIKGYTRKVKKC